MIFLTTDELIQRIYAATTEDKITGIEFFKKIAEPKKLQEGAIFSGLNLAFNRQSFFDPGVIQLGYVNAYDRSGGVKRVAYDDMPAIEDIIPTSKDSQVTWCVDTNKMDAWDQLRGTYLKDEEIFLTGIDLRDSNFKPLKEIDPEFQAKVKNLLVMKSPTLGEVVGQWQKEWLKNNNHPREDYQASFKATLKGVKEYQNKQAAPEKQKVNRTYKQ